MRVYDFYGVCGNTYKLNDTVWEAIEDEADGWRSYLGSIKSIKNDGIFSDRPIAQVNVISSEEYDDGYKLVDINTGHVWLEFGTDNSDGWYPCFRFDYNIDEKKTVYNGEFAGNDNWENEEWQRFIR